MVIINYIKIKSLIIQCEAKKHYFDKKVKTVLEKEKIQLSVRFIIVPILRLDMKYMKKISFSVPLNLKFNRYSMIKT